jgi:hypothetical protein
MTPALIIATLFGVCPACRDTGDTEYGHPCGWCALGHGPDDTDDEPSADESARLRAIERSYMR